MPSVLADLRSLVPHRPLTPSEALRISELQAIRFLEASGITEPPVPESVIADLPRIQVDRLAPIPVSGSAHWMGSRWVIVLNGAEPIVRQRFSLAHEFKHVLDNPFDGFLYPASGDMSSAELAEQVADYFAACLLMPRPWLKRIWCNETQDVDQLSRKFEVSKKAIHIRLQKIGLVDELPESKHKNRIVVHGRAVVRLAA